MWTADFRFSWGKMETAAQDRAGGDEWSVAVYDTLGLTSKSYKSRHDRSCIRFEVCLSSTGTALELAR